jgi:multimeric flavodoxin WrbA
MNVLAVNGSPHEKGCTYTALSIMQEELKKENISAKILHIGADPIKGCVGCKKCADTKKCVYDNDIVNKAIDMLYDIDGLILASPVHFSGIAGSMKCFLDRLFYAAGSSVLEYKASAAFVVLRRSGGSSALDQLNHYLHYSKTAVASSHYWNIIHGQNPDELYKDEEGVQILKYAARNLAWLMKSINESRVSLPPKEQRVRTNFIK